MDTSTVVTTITTLISTTTTFTDTTTITGITINPTSNAIDLTYGIVAVFLVLISFVLFFLGAKSFKKRRDSSSFTIWGYASLIFGFLSLLFGFFAVSWMNLSDVFMAWGTLTLAIVTIATLDENKRLTEKATIREEQYRKETLEREERDRQERLDKEQREHRDLLLKEIGDWASEIYTITATCTYTTEKDFQILITAIQKLRVLHIRFKEIAKSIDGSLATFVRLDRKVPSFGEDLLNDFVSDITRAHKDMIIPEGNIKYPTLGIWMYAHDSTHATLKDLIEALINIMILSSLLRAGLPCPSPKEWEAALKEVLEKLHLKADEPSKQPPSQQ